MKPFVEWRVFAEARFIPVVTSGLEAFCRALDVGQEHSVRLQLAVEGVLNYCMPLACKSLSLREVTVRAYMVDHVVKVELEHEGPRGPLDHFFAPGAPQGFKRNSFEALGMSMAAELTDEMVFRMVARMNASSALNRYSLSYDTERPRPGAESSLFVRT